MKVNTLDMRNKILKCVSQNPKAANDDKYLISLIWSEEGWDDMRGLYENLKNVSSSETIRRTRQKLVEEGLIKPSEKVTQIRHQECVRIATDFRGNKIVF